MLYRTNAQSRSFEESFRARGIRYRLLGGFSFYQRAEIKDALAYVRLAISPDDDVALLRVLNTPPRGIGKTSVDALRALARERGLPFGALWAKPSPPAAAAHSRPCEAFARSSKICSRNMPRFAPAEFFEAVLDITGYLDMLRQRDSAEDIAPAILNAISMSYLLAQLHC